MTKCEQQNETRIRDLHTLDLVLNVAKQWIGLYIVHVLNSWYICDKYLFLFEWPPPPPTSPPPPPPTSPHPASPTAAYSRERCIAFSEMKSNVKKWSFRERRSRASTAAVSKSVATVSNQMQRNEIIIWTPPGSSFHSGGLEISSDGLKIKCNVKKRSFGDRRARALTAAVSKSVATVSKPNAT